MSSKVKGQSSKVCVILSREAKNPGAHGILRPSTPLGAQDDNHER